MLRERLEPLREATAEAAAACERLRSRQLGLATALSDLSVRKKQVRSCCSRSTVSFADSLPHDWLRSISKPSISACQLSACFMKPGHSRGMLHRGQSMQVLTRSAAHHHKGMRGACCRSIQNALPLMNMACHSLLNLKSPRKQPRGRLVLIALACGCLGAAGNCKPAEGGQAAGGCSSGQACCQADP